MRQDKKIIQAAYNQASDVVREAINSEEGEVVLQALYKKKNLPPEKSKEISSETTLVMLGLTKPEEFVQSIVSRTGLSEDVARSIGQEINEKIFRPIRDELRSVHGLPGIETSRPEQQTQPSRQTIPPSNLPATALEQHLAKQTQAPWKEQRSTSPSEGLVPLQKKPSVPDFSRQLPQKPVFEMNRPSQKTQTSTPSLGMNPNTSPAQFKLSDEETVLDKQNLLRSIESEAPAHKETWTASMKEGTLQSGNILSRKLTEVTRLPKEEVRSNQNPIKKEYSADPYREAL